MTINAVITEIPQHVTKELSMGKKFARQIGEALNRFAIEQQWCDTYDQALTSSFSSDVLESEAWREFENAAKRDRKEERTFTVSASLEISSDSYTYDINESAYLTATGTYQVPVGMEISDLADLDNDDIEHTDGTDLVEWFNDMGSVRLFVNSIAAAFEQDEHLRPFAFQ